MDGFICDLRVGARLWWHDRGASLVAILSLALGVGANVAVFSVVRALLLAEMPYPEARRIAVISKLVPGLREQPLDVAELEVVRQAPAYRDAAGCTSAAVVARGTIDAEEGQVTRVTSNFFRVFAVAPTVGRPLGEFDIRSSARVAVISHDFWVSQFGRSPDVLGRALRVNRLVWTVVGVMPPGFAPPCGGPSKRVVWVPYVETEDLVGVPPHRLAGLSVFVRLPAGVTLEAARSEMRRLIVLPGRADARVGTEMALDLLGEREAASVRSGLLLSQAVAILLLAVACTNLATLLTARAWNRTAEVGARLAVGAQPTRIVRQFITEGASIASIGGIAGVALAFGMVQLLVALAPGSSSRVASIGVRLPELLLGLAASWLTWALSALGPAVAASRLDPLSSLRGKLLVSQNRPLSWLRSVFVGSQVFFAVVILTAAGLLAKSFLHVLGQPLGFETRGLVVAEVFAPLGLGELDYYRQFARQLEQAVRVRLPRTSVALASDMPYTSTRSTASWRIANPGGADYRDDCSSSVVSVSPEYFDVLRIAVVRGRSIASASHTSGEPVAVVNEQFVRVYGRARDLIGYRLSRRGGEPVTIVGVVGDTRSFRVTSPAIPTVYTALHSTSTNRLSIAVRGVSILELSAVVREAVRSVDADIPVRSVVSVQAEAWRREHSRTFYALLMAIFGALACVLVAVGLFGIVAHAVSSRRFELGLRVALGARPIQLVNLVLFRTLLPAAVGLTGGVLATGVVARLLTDEALLVDQLYGTQPGDVVVLGVAIVGLLGIAVVACAHPLRSALRTDPIAVLKAE